MPRVVELNPTKDLSKHCPDPDCMALDCNCGLGPCCEGVAYGDGCTCGDEV